MLNSIRDFAQHPEHALYDSCVVVVLTHGEYDYLTGVDGDKVYSHGFISALDAKNAPNLAGKPKIFIFQACRGGNLFKSTLGILKNSYSCPSLHKLFF